MKYDDGRHGCMREEDKKREFAMKLQCSNPKVQTLMLKLLLQNHFPNLQHNNTITTNIMKMRRRWLLIQSNVEVGGFLQPIWDNRF